VASKKKEAVEGEEAQGPKPRAKRVAKVKAPPLMTDRQFYSKIAGVSFKNDNGVARQDIIRTHCRAGMELHLMRVHDIPGNPNAVAVFVRACQKYGQIGHITSDAASDVSEHMDRDLEVGVLIAEVTGGGDRFLGVNISISLLVKPATWAPGAEPLAEDRARSFARLAQEEEVYIFTVEKDNDGDDFGLWLMWGVVVLLGAFSLAFLAILSLKFNH
jgi:hypothetical protein